MKKTILIIAIILHLFYINSKINSEEIASNFIGDNIYIVVGDYVNVREEPTQTSKVIFKQRIATIVSVLKRINKKVTIDKNDGEWVFIDTKYFKTIGDSETAKGWVFDYYLSDLSNFKRMESSIECYMEYWAGDSLFSIQINNNGTYIRKNYSYEKKYYYFTLGKLYKYRNVIFAKDDKSNVYDLLFVNDKGIVCSGRLCAQLGKKK